jgi:hypothetical protein
MSVKNNQPRRPEVGAADIMFILPVTGVPYGYTSPCQVKAIHLPLHGPAPHPRWFNPK